MAVMVVKPDLQAVVDEAGSVATQEVVAMIHVPAVMEAMVAMVVMAVMAVAAAGPTIGVLLHHTTLIRSDLTITVGTPGNSGASAGNAGAGGSRTNQLDVP